MPSIRGPECLNALTRSYLPLRVLICPYAFLYALNPGARVLICPFAFLYALNPGTRVLICPLHLITDILSSIYLTIASIPRLSVIRLPPEIPPRMMNPPDEDRIVI